MNADSRRCKSDGCPKCHRLRQEATEGRTFCCKAKPNSSVSQSDSGQFILGQTLRISLQPTISLKWPGHFPISEQTNHQVKAAPRCVSGFERGGFCIWATVVRNQAK